MVIKPKVGDFVWFDCGHIECGTIIELFHNNGEKFARIKCKIIPGTTNVLVEELYKTKSAVEQACKDKVRRIEDSYRAQINGVEALIKFCFKHDVSECEYRDVQAYNVAREKAKELLDIEI